MIYTAFLLGLLGSLHCVGMCGPIAFMLPLDRGSKPRMFGQLFLYHAGRIFSYSLMGLIFGYFGKGLYLFGIQQNLSIAIGILILLVLVIPKKFVRRFEISRPVYRWVGKLKSGLGDALKKRTADTFLTIGVLNGFLPCGLVYMAVFASIAMSSPVLGASYMALFGLGTIPLMSSAAYIGGILQPAVRARIRRLIPIFVAVLGLLFILRGMGLGIPYVSPKPASPQVTAQMECHQP
ncbi:sulfite exporter TauE/SafE family protein [Muriicola marianensis]|uniref:Membrane protein n=1 Tax=Muriicola marianensis TaxID=1324801 RepID=A0ABQ1QUU6_9FLAO|nr:sulfite exporter TauE/SafE family protein [Muriicola marianensis]GGD47307.1 membrane protein [Muriicola marianensis]